MADIRLTTRQALIGAIILGLTMYYVFAVQLAMSKDFITPAGPPVGGDFVVFWAAAKAAIIGNISGLYDPAYFQAWLSEIGPPHDSYSVTWQYPPTYFFAISFLALLPFGWGYAAWTGGSFVVFAAALRSAGVRGFALLFVLAAPVVFQAAITGQNGFWTAGLLMGAALYPDKRPVVAGLCAALLTMKPQLGILLPFAYLAGGYWRAFGWAAAGSLALVLASIAVFGLDPWTAFIESIIGASTALNAGIMPLTKISTMFSAFMLAGAPKMVAVVMHGLGVLAAIWATIVIWRRYDNRALRAGVICAGAYFVSPYIFYYELVIMAAPIALLALQAHDEGWRPHDQLILGALFLTPLFVPGDSRQTGFNLGFAVTTLAFIFILRRMRLQSLPASGAQFA